MDDPSFVEDMVLPSCDVTCHSLYFSCLRSVRLDLDGPVSLVCGDSDIRGHNGQQDKGTLLPPPLSSPAQERRRGRELLARVPRERQQGGSHRPRYPFSQM